MWRATCHAGARVERTLAQKRGAWAIPTMALMCQNPATRSPSATGSGLSVWYDGHVDSLSVGMVPPDKRQAGAW